MNSMSATSRGSNGILPTLFSRPTCMVAGMMATAFNVGLLVQLWYAWPGNKPSKAKAILAYKNPHKQKQVCSSCWSDGSRGSLTDLPNVLLKLAKATDERLRQLYLRFFALFEVQKRKSSPSKSSSFFMKKMRSWLGGRDDLTEQSKQQTVVHVQNRWTDDGIIYNPLRSKRPVQQQSTDELEYIDNITQEAVKTCDFCDYAKSTGSDTFGRLHGNYCVTASNAFKLEVWHSMVLFHSHHPLYWSQLEFQDAFKLAWKWFKHVYTQNTAYIYPVILWDLLPKAGGSQIHPHIHTMLGPDGYYGAQERWRKIAEEYEAMYPGRNYFSDIVMVHEALGLGVRLGKAVAYASLTPKRDYEIVVISQSMDNDFITLLHHVVRTYIEDLNKYAFSLAVTLPSMESKEGDAMPAIARIVSRGVANEVYSDVTTLELFAASNANVDPFDVARQLRASIRRRLGVFDEETQTWAK